MSTATWSGGSVTYMTLDAAGKGAIESHDNQQERLDEVTERVGSGEFHQPTEGTIPCTCIDGRCGGKDGLMPNSAGGTETLMVADDLTTKRFARDDSSTCGQYGTLLQFLKETGHPIGGHTAVDCHGAPSGCGANDKLDAIYEYLSQNGATLRSIAESLEYDISDITHELIVKNAANRLEFSRGDQLLDTLRKHDGRVDMLEGDHTEVVAVINRRQGTTLDRDAVREAFGDDYEAFNVDEWSFETAAKVISETGEQNDIQQKRLAMLYYNLATAGVLCGPAMRVVILG